MKKKEAENLWIWGIDSLRKPENSEMLDGILQRTMVHEFKGNKITIRVDNDFLLEIIRKKYLSSVVEKVRELTKNHELTIDFIIEKFPDNNITENRDEVIEKKLRKLGFNPKYTFKNFVVSSSNQFAHAVSKAVANSPGTQYNPLFIYGGVGLGKTHILQAIGNRIIKKNPGMDVIYLPCEVFLNEMIESIRSGRLKSFRKKYRTVDVLLIDDIQFLAGKEQTQEEFFNTFNELHNSGKQIVLSSDRPPHEIKKVEKRLISRFESGMVADIQPPDYELRMAILKKRAQNENCRIEDSVLSYLVDKITSNIRKLEGAFTTLIGKAKILHREITLELVDEVLKSHTSESSRKVTIELVMKKTAEYFSVEVEQIRGKRRLKQIVHPRQVCMYLCRELTGSTLEEIGEKFGKRDHSTILYGCNKIEEELKKDNQSLKNELEEIKSSILSG